MNFVLLKIRNSRSRWDSGRVDPGGLFQRGGSSSPPTLQGSAQCSGENATPLITTGSHFTHSNVITLIFVLTFTSLLLFASSSTVAMATSAGKSTSRNLLTCSMSTAHVCHMAKPRLSIETSRQPWLA